MVIEVPDYMKSIEVFFIATSHPIQNKSLLKRNPKNDGPGITSRNSRKQVILLLNGNSCVLGFRSEIFTGCIWGYKCSTWNLLKQKRQNENSQISSIDHENIQQGTPATDIRFESANAEHILLKGATCLPLKDSEGKFSCSSKCGVYRKYMILSQSALFDFLYSEFQKTV